VSGAKQTKAPYPPTFVWAVKPDEVDWNLCDHEADEPICFCAHDWRIVWGNVERADQSQSLFVTDSI
jgi:hypothetical protein